MPGGGEKESRARKRATIAAWLLRRGGGSDDVEMQCQCEAGIMVELREVLMER